MEFLQVVSRVEMMAVEKVVMLVDYLAAQTDAEMGNEMVGV